MRQLVEYRFVNPDGTEWGRMDPIEFDTSYCMAGHPFRIFTGGEWWQAFGGPKWETIPHELGVDREFIGRTLFVMFYRQEDAAREAATTEER